MLLGDMRRAVAGNTDVILFNIDTKAEPRATATRSCRSS